MKNILAGWFTSLLGFVIIAMALLDFYGVVPIPAPAGVTEFQQVAVAFLAGLFLFVVPRGKVERLLLDRFSKK